jgi:hypothetical protein
MGNLMMICSMMKTTMKGGNKDLRFSHKSSKIMEFGVLDFSNFNVVKCFSLWSIMCYEVEGC